MFRGQHSVGFQVCLGAGPHGIAAVWEADVCPVEGPMRGRHLPEPQLTQGEVGA